MAKLVEGGAARKVRAITLREVARELEKMHKRGQRLISYEIKSEVLEIGGDRSLDRFRFFLPGAQSLFLKITPRPPKAPRRKPKAKPAGPIAWDAAPSWEAERLPNCRCVLTPAEKRRKR
jgi:hypothetical protein